MSFALDPEIAAVMADQADFAIETGVPPPVRGDAKALHPLAEPGLKTMYDALGSPLDVFVETHSVDAHDGSTLEVRWYERTEGAVGPCVVYAHGGGHDLRHAGHI